MNTRNVRKIVIICIALIAILVLFLTFKSANRERKFTKAMSRFHLISKGLEWYVRDHNTFPDNLDELLRVENLDSGLLLPLDNEKIEYVAPNENDPPGKPVLVMTGYGRKVILRKDFERVKQRE